MLVSLLVSGLLMVLEETLRVLNTTVVLTRKTRKSVDQCLKHSVKDKTDHKVI